MGRDKNKANNARQSNKKHSGGGSSGGGGKAPTITKTTSAGRGVKKDTGLPAYFKQRRQAELAAAAAAASRRNIAAERLTRMDTEAEAASVSATSWSKRQDSGLAVALNAGDGFERASRDLALSGKRDNSAKAYMREVKNVIENSDVILSVLDARDPLGSRSKQTEVLAMGHGKKVVLVLNKVDLIPTSNLQAWLRYLRNDFPTLAFKASTQQQRTHLKQGRGQVDLPASAASSKQLSFGSEAIGATALLQLLKNYARTAVKGSSVKQQLSVGVVGPPNVGKSSLINSLLRTRACAVASTPGWTKVVQGVMLEKGIRLLDCPGVVLGGVGDDEGATKEEAGWSVLRNTVKVELIEDPIAPIQAMLTRVDAEQLTKLYSIEGGFNEGDAYDFLLRVALLRGKLGKGGVPDLDGAARIVLHDWNVGRIAFHSQPPVVHHSLRHTEATSEAVQDMAAAAATTTDNGTSLVSGFSEAFDLEALLGEADAEAFGVKKIASSQGGSNGKDLITPRERVYAKRSEDAVAIEEDDEGVAAASSAQDSSRSSLGKRVRGMVEVAPSDDEDEAPSDGDDQSDNDDEDGSAVQQTVSISGQAFDASVAPSRGRSAQSRDPAVKRETILSRQQRELQRAMGEFEVAGMARRRSDVRREAKKSRKRVRKSGAGLVDAMTSALAFQGEGYGANALSSKSRRGMFDVPEANPNASQLISNNEDEEL